MPTVFELLGDQPQDTQVPVAETPGQFGKGLRSGLYGAGASGMALAGNIAENVAPGYAKGIYDTSRELQAEAGRHAPRVGKFDDVTNLRDFYDYATGLVGGSIPHSAVALGGGLMGRTPVGRVLGATLASTPLHAGEVVQRQHDDPLIAQQDAGTRLRDAVIGGGLAASVESIVPAAVAGKIASIGTKAAAPTLRSIPGSVAGNIAMEGATEAAGEAVKQGTLMQANDARTLDTDALREAAIGGAIGGAPLAAVGGVADAVKVASTTPSNVLSGGMDLLNKGKDAAGAALGAVKDKAADSGYDLDTPVSSFAKMVQDGTAATKQWVKDVAEGKGGAGFDPSATAEEILAKMPAMDAERAQRTAQMAKDLMAKVEVPQALKDRLKTVTDFADKAQQAVVAGAQRAYDETIRWKDRAKATAKGDTGDIIDAEAREVSSSAGALTDGTRKSKDYSGLRKVIADAMVPILKKHKPNVLADNDSINLAADEVRLMVDRITTPGMTLTLKDIAHLESLFGPEGANEMLESAFKAMKGNDAAAYEAFAGAMTQAMDVQDDHLAFVDVLKKNYAPGQAPLNDDDIADLAWRLEQWATDSRVGERKSAADAPDKAFTGKKMMREFKVLFGNQAQTVMDALEARTARDTQGESKIQQDLDKNEMYGLDERGGATVSERMKNKSWEVDAYGTGTNQDELVLAPKYHADKKLNQVTAALERARKDYPEEKYPNHEIRFVTAEELGEDHPSIAPARNKITKELTDANPKLLEPKNAERLKKAVDKELKKYGMVVAEGDKEDLVIRRRDLKKLRLVTDEGDSYKNESRIDVEVNGKKHVFDARAITRMANAQMEWSNEDNMQGGTYRQARAFATGLANLSLHLGRTVEVAPDTVVAQTGKTRDGKPIYLRYKDIKDIDVRTNEDKARDSVRRALRDYDAQFKKAEDAGDDEGMRKVLMESRDYVNGFEDQTARSLLEADDTDPVTRRKLGPIDPASGKPTLGEVIMDGDRPKSFGRKRNTDVGAHYDSQGNITDEGMAEYFRSTQREHAKADLRDDQVHIALRGKGEVDFRRREDDPAVALNDKKGKQQRPKTDQEKGVGFAKGPQPDIGERQNHQGRTETVAGDLSTLVDKFETLKENGKPAQQALADRVLWAVNNMGSLPDKARRAVTSLANAKVERKLSDYSAVIDPIYAAHSSKVKQPVKKDLPTPKEKPKPITKEAPAEPAPTPAPAPAAKTLTAQERQARLNARVDEMVAKDDYKSLTTDEKTIAFLKAANRRYRELRAKYDSDAEMSDTEVAAHNRLDSMFDRGSHEDLASFFPGFPANAPMDNTEVRAMLKADAAPEVAAKSPKGEKRFSLVGNRAKFERVEGDFDNYIGAIGPSVGPIKHPLLAAHLDENGDVEVELFDREHPNDSAILTFDLFKNDAGKWEFGMDGPQPDTQSHARYRSHFDTVEVDNFDYTKFKPGVFSVADMRTLSRAVRDLAADLGVKPAEVVWGRDTGAKAGKGHTASIPAATLARLSKQATNSSNTTSPIAEALTRKAIDDMLGTAVKVEFVPLQQHAGEYTVEKGQAIIRISGHALNPLSVGYHESLHAFFGLLAKDKNAKISGVLARKAMEPHIQQQLKTLLAGEPDALAQLTDAEEAAAYMFQFWMDGNITLTSPPLVVGFFGALKNAIVGMVKKWTGIKEWSSAEHAENIMQYLKDGHFKTNLKNPEAVHAALWEAAKDKRLEIAKKMLAPIAKAGDILLTPAAMRLRDSGVPALRQLADLSKRQLVQDGEDPGYLPAARYRYTRFMNRLATKLQGFTEAELKEALEAMQDPSKKATAGAAALQIIDYVQNPQTGVLSGMLTYMRRSGVDVDKRVKARADYFPRVYDTDYIRRHQKDFATVLERHGIPDGMAVVRNLIANDGNEFTLETNKPGNQFQKERKLASIPDSELARFMVKDPYKILSGYIMQSTRQAEWAKRFGDDGSKLTKLLLDAERQGATKEDLRMADNYVKAINGTLGDTLNPGVRNMMGNVIVYQNWRLLPLAIFSNLVDPVGIMVRGGTVGDAFNAWKRGMKEIRASFSKVYQGDADVKLAEAIGTIDNAVLAHEMSSLYTQGMVGDHAKKINDILFRYNMVEGMQRGMRVAATQAAIKFLERHADGTASPHSVRWLAEVGLKPGDITGPIDGTSNVKIKAAVNRWVDGAVLRPDAADRALWMSDPHYMLFSHLKQFAFAFQETILKRVIHEAKQGNYQPVMALASYVPFMIAADALKHALQGGGEVPEWKRNWGVSEYVGAGIERAGLLGARQFGVDAIQDVMRGEVWMGGLTGPAVDQAMEGLSVIGGRVNGSSWILDALPANALYQGVVKG